MKHVLPRLLRPASLRLPDAARGSPAGPLPSPPVPVPEPLEPVLPLLGKPAPAPLPDSPPACGRYPLVYDAPLVFVYEPAVYVPAADMPPPAPPYSPPVMLAALCVNGGASRMTELPSARANGAPGRKSVYPDWVVRAAWLGCGSAKPCG